MVSQLEVEALDAVSAWAVRGAAAMLVIGTVLYVVPSALHGNPPIDSAEETLRYVAERPTWRVVHLVNILAVVLWAGAFAVVRPWLGGAAAAVGRINGTVFAVAAAVFGVYFSIHAFALPASAEHFTDAARDEAAVLSQTESVLVVLGATAFTAQALLGSAILLFGLTMALSGRLPQWLGWVGVVAGAGWLAGAIAVKFSVIVPFTVLTWVWTLSIGFVLWRRAGRASLR